MSGFPDGKLVQNISLVGNKNITRTHKLSIKGNDYENGNTWETWRFLRDWKTLNK